MVAAPRTFLTKGDGTRWLAATETDQFRGLWLDPSRGRATLQEYSSAWLAARVTLAPRTREIYATQLRLHILPTISAQVPALGELPLSALSPDLIRAWYAALCSAKSTSVAAKAYTRLRQILRQAVDDERIAKNPCRIDSGGAERHPEQQFASLPELYRLADAVPEQYRALILTAGLAGLRRGELFALRRADVDLLNGNIAVRRKRLRLASGVVIEDAPKTAAGRRTVALPGPLLAELERHLATFAGPRADAYVFISAKGQPIEASNFRYRIWLPATKAAGLTGLRFHSLRHTAGTLAARTGATTKELMARLGHASPQAAMVYQHACQDRDRVIAEGLAAMTIEAGLARNVPIDREDGSRAAQEGR